MINSFEGQYRFLSNFWPCQFTYQGVTFLNAEAAYHSQKEPHRASDYADLDPMASKRRGRQILLRSDWEQVKDGVMWDVLQAKFDQNEDLREQLLATGDQGLEEGNTWGDRYWGTVNGEGQNKLGAMLMHLREILRWEREFERSARFAIHEDFLKLNDLAQRVDVQFPDTPGAFTGTPSERLARQFKRMTDLLDKYEADRRAKMEPYERTQEDLSTPEWTEPN